MTLYLGRSWQSWLLTVALQAYLDWLFHVDSPWWALLVAFICVTIVPKKLTFRSLKSRA